MISLLSQSELTAIGLRLSGAYLVRQAGYTLGIAAADGAELEKLLRPDFMVEVGHTNDDVAKAMQDRAIAGFEAKQSTGVQNESLRDLKIWRRKVAKHARRAALSGTKVPDELTNMARSQAVARILEDANKALGLLAEHVAQIDTACPGTQALIDEGTKIYGSVAKADSAQEQSRTADLPAAVAAFNAKKGALYIGLKIINEAGHQLHAADTQNAGKYNLSILYRNRSSAAPAPAPVSPSASTAT